MDYEKKIWEIYEQEMASRNDADYVPNKPQMKKLSEAYRFFVEYAKQNGGRVETLKLIPKKESCGVTAYFTLFAPFGEELENFKRVMQNVSAISIDALVDGNICISINIPHVFVHR